MVDGYVSVASTFSQTNSLRQAQALPFNRTCTNFIIDVHALSPPRPIPSRKQRQQYVPICSGSCLDGGTVATTMA